MKEAVLISTAHRDIDSQISPGPVIALHGKFGRVILTRMFVENLIQQLSAVSQQWMIVLVL